MKWPISSHSNQAEHHAPCHHAECQHKLVEPCSDLLVAASVSVVLVGVAPSFAAAEQEHHIVVAAVGEHTAAAVADSQHYTAAAAVVVLDRILLERTCWYGFTANRRRLSTRYLWHGVIFVIVVFYFGGSSASHSSSLGI